MTAIEAIEILRDTPIDIRSTREDDIHTLYATAQGMALDALEKQIPKKPLDDFSTHAIYVNDGNYLDQIDIRTFKCPICNHILARGEIETTDCAEIHYCDNCGRRLDWSDTNG